MDPSNWFSKNISNILTCIKIDEFNFSRLDIFSDKMMLQLNMFGSGMID